MNSTDGMIYIGSCNYRLLYEKAHHFILNKVINIFVSITKRWCSFYVDFDLIR